MPARQPQIQALHSLAREVAELADSEKNRGARQRWMDHNALKGQRPLVYAAIGCWDEIIRPDELIFQEGPCRDIEKTLRQTLYNARLGFDFVVDPFFTVPAVMTGPSSSEIWGVPIEHRAAPEQKGAWGYNPPLKSYDDLGKLKKPRYAVDEEATLRRADIVREAVGGHLEVRVDYGGLLGISAALGQKAADLRGLEQLMTDVVDCPECVHALMRFLMEAQIEYMQDMEAQGRVTPNHVRWPFYHAPLRGDYDPERVRLQDCWGWAESQEFDLFSPSMFEEFLLQYQLPILARTSLNNYGCCENLANKYALLKKIPGLRRVSVSPWSSMEKAVEELGGRCVFNWRYNPTEVIFSFSEKNIRQTLQRYFRMAGYKSVEVVLQDVQTVNGNPDIIRQWVEIAGQEAGVDRRSSGMPRRV